MTREEFLAWRSEPITKEVMKYAQFGIQILKDEWFNDQFSATTVEEMALRNAKAVGRAQGLAEMLELTYEIYAETFIEYGDIEHEWSEAPGLLSSVAAVRSRDENSRGVSDSGDIQGTDGDQ